MASINMQELAALGKCVRAIEGLSLPAQERIVKHLLEMIAEQAGSEDV